VRRLLWILLAVLLIVLAVIVFSQNQAAWTDLVRFNGTGIEKKIFAVAFACILALALLRHRFSHTLESILIWICIALILVLGYAYRFELHDIAERVLAELIPGRAISKGRSVEIARGASGSFGVSAQVNGARIAMVLDTGASAVVLTHEAARAAGLPVEVLAYSVMVETANGRARAAPVTLDRISVGGITERSVPALIAQPNQLRTSLLGMTFLNRLERWEVRGDRLLLRGYP
jgi:aspartyl protease family protein